MAQIAWLNTYFKHNKGGATLQKLKPRSIYKSQHKKEKAHIAPSLPYYRCKTNLELKTKYFRISYWSFLPWAKMTIISLANYRIITLVLVSWSVWRILYPAAILV